MDEIGKRFRLILMDCYQREFNLIKEEKNIVRNFTWFSCGARIFNQHCLPFPLRWISKRYKKFTKKNPNEYEMAPSQFSFNFEVMSKQSKKFQLTSTESFTHKTATHYHHSALMFLLAFLFFSLSLVFCCAVNLSFIKISLLIPFTISIFLLTLLLNMKSGKFAIF